MMLGQSAQCLFCCCCFPGIPGSVEFVEGKGGLPTAVLKHKCGSTAKVSLWEIVGACVKKATAKQKHVCDSMSL